jgi:predicted SAM-dependent methyltransferase
LRYANLGCGARFHTEWINLDLAPAAPGVIACDLGRGVPLPDAHCDAVYHSHVLEHLRREQALPFLRECRRVLKPGGILRVVVPDLEQACREYLRALEAARAGDAGDARRHEWMTLELLDQMVREREGGAMLDYLRRATPTEAAYVRERIGEEADRVLEALRGEAPPPWRARLSRGLAAAAGGFALVRFRRSGERHRWMYDTHSLAQLLRAAGFDSVEARSPGASSIAGWSRFHLDATPAGEERRPNSLYMEATKAA